ncbi:tyrosine-type recombinase/integrase [Zhongshania sp. BJYM1]|uniref:tyrosine-type recombinase/integrase n=1 Tax=Zhongshania aquatica TaxID=2965069 RepID=UPI0022B5C13B|nr:site-specific integrase [Marortus sp. BJYM1]
MNLDPREIKELSDPGTYGDGEGLYLQVAKAGTKSWIYRYQINGRRRFKGLGGFPAISLSEARKERNRLRLKVKAGIDPLDEKADNVAKASAERKAEAARKMTFRNCAETYIDDMSPHWKNRKHEQQWRNTLKTYAYPVIGDKPAADIELDDVLAILQPIWLEKTETATRVRNRIELVIDWANVRKYGSGNNPARWKGNLDKVLPKPSKLKKVKHHNALPYDEAAVFMAALKKQPGSAAKVLQLVILTATRTSEAIEATWSEFDLKKAVWTIPAERMKGEKEQRIPLSKPALSILHEMKNGITGDIYVFPGQKVGRPLSNMAMIKVLHRMERKDITVHGFRSTFRDWVAEQTNFPRRVAEMALAHKLKDGAEAAYQRGDLIKKRTDLMDAWAAYCVPVNGNVIKLRA